jgi:hypothetical protein
MRASKILPIPQSKSPSNARASHSPKLEELLQPIPPPTLHSTVSAPGPMIQVGSVSAAETIFIKNLVDEDPKKSPQNRVATGSKVEMPLKPTPASAPVSGELNYPIKEEPAVPNSLSW